MTDQIRTKASLKGDFETGDTPTGSQFNDLISSNVTMGSDTNVLISTSADYNLELDDSNSKGPGKTYVYDYIGGDIIFNLPSVDATNIGTWYQIVNISGRKVSILANDSDTIEDSDPAGSIYNGDSFEDMSSSSAESGAYESELASVKVQLISATQWHVVHGRKTWTSTQFV